MLKKYVPRAFNKYTILRYCYMKRKEILEIIEEEDIQNVNKWETTSAENTAQVEDWKIVENWRYASGIYHEGYTQEKPIYF